ncbi:hypothetical protein AXW67_25790 [Bradyrhizobium neotropicale]|nr:hypothetical protein AXW67_25790 [Bradyrhizobium neotropicale]
MGVMRMAVRAGTMRNAKEFRRLQLIYPLQAEHSMEDLERDSLLISLDVSDMRLRNSKDVQ